MDAQPSAILASLLLMLSISFENAILLLPFVRLVEWFLICHSLQIFNICPHSLLGLEVYVLSS